MNSSSDKPNNWLSKYREKTTSQFGEEGVFEEIFEIIKDNTPVHDETRWCVEFGAGRENSNTRALINDSGWFGVLIETNPVYYNDLYAFYKNNSRVSCFNRLVGFEGPNTLDKILQKTKIPHSFNLLIIDIDGNDYHVWESFKLYRPNVVMIEYNCRIPFDVEFIQPRDNQFQWGSSLSSIVKLGKDKGYELVYAYGSNAIFVKKELFDFFGINDNSLKMLTEEYVPEAHFFQLYDGTIILYGCDRLLAHKKKIYKKPLYLLTPQGLLPVEFTYDRKIVRIVKNFIKNSPLYAFAYPFAERFYGRRWEKKKKELNRIITGGKEGVTIGILLHPYDEKNPAGLGRYILELAKSIIAQDKNNRYILYLKKKPKIYPVFPGDNWKIEVLNDSYLWLGLGLRRARRSDIYIFSTPILPLFFRPQKAIVIALDFAYKYFPASGLRGFIIGKVLSLYHGWSLKKAFRIVSMSQTTKRDIIKFYKIPEEKISIIYPGFTKIREMTEEVVNIEGKFFLFVGVLKERKNPFGVVRAFVQFSEKHKDYTLVIAGKGSGPYYEMMRKYIQESHMQDKILLTGFVTDNQLSYLYKHAEALVFPSILEGGFCFPVFEAMDYGLPVITSGKGPFESMEETVGDAAILVDPCNIDDIATAMERIITDHDIRRMLVQKGYAQVKKFSWDKSAREMKNIIDLTVHGV